MRGRLLEVAPRPASSGPRFATGGGHWGRSHPRADAGVRGGYAPPPIPPPPTSHGGAAPRVSASPGAGYLHAYGSHAAPGGRAAASLPPAALCGRWRLPGTSPRGRGGCWRRAGREGAFKARQLTPGGLRGSDYAESARAAGGAPGEPRGGPALGGRDPSGPRVKDREVTPTLPNLRGPLRLGRRFLEDREGDRGPEGSVPVPA